MRSRSLRSALDPRCFPLYSAPAVFLAIVAGTLGTSCVGQDTSPKGTVKDGYTVHQSFDLGGHIVSHSGSDATYDTLVNLQSGPRILNQTLEMHVVGKSKYPQFFDDLMENSTGYGGDPNNFTMLRMSKGKLYDFHGYFRRDRQYFDYNLLANPLVPAGLTSNGYTFPQVLDSPHYFNTVRRMTDTSLALFPISKFSFHAGYSQNISQGPTGSSTHVGADALLQQNWRNSTDSWFAALDWKPFSKTTLTYEEYITHYKGDTNWQLTGLNLQLANGTPVTLGFDNTTVPNCSGGPAIRNSSTIPPTANPNCNGYLQYQRYAPTRTLFPTEEFRFQSSNLARIQMNGRVRYTGANTNLPSYFEYFNGLSSRTRLRASTVTGYSTGQRVNVSADYGIVWQISEKIHLSDQYDFWDFRQPGTNFLSEIDQAGTSMLATPGAPGVPSITTAQNFLGQKTSTNTLVASWDIAPWAQWSVGYRYSSRTIVVTDTGESYTVPIHENGGVSGIVLRPTSQWRVNGNIEVMYADKVYTQISPRALQHYRLRSTYKPKNWATITGSFNDLERRDNVIYVNHLDHSRSFTAGASLTPSDHYGIDFSYGYIDVFTRTDECYTSSVVPAGTPTASPACVANGTPRLGTGYYDAPTQFGSIDLVFAPVQKLHANLGYRMSAVNGTTEFLNPRQVPGSLQSQFQTPYGNVAWTLEPGWLLRAEWNYYGYGEGTPIGPTAPRSFRGNVYTLGVHYEF